MRKVLPYLRIAFSVTCGILCLLLVVLWVRSYWRYDAFQYRPTFTIYARILATQGTIVFSVVHDATGEFGLVSPPVGNWWLTSFPFLELSSAVPELSLLKKLFRGFAFGNDAWQVPDWFLVLVSATFAAAPWFRWRFSLRTLLIAMTLVAILLGAIVFWIR